MKINKKINIDINTNINSLQDNQRKDNLKNLNQRVKSSKNYSIAYDSIINKNFKRNMFTKFSSHVFKKSGKIMINTEFKNETTTISFISSPRIRLNALTNLSRFNSTNIEINKTLASTYFTQPSNNAIFNQMSRGNFKVIEPRDCIAEFSSDERYSFLWKEIDNLKKNGKITKEQWIAFSKRLEGLYHSYVHNSVMERIKEENGYVTYQYYLITTKNKEVDYGGPNIFKPLFLYTDLIKKKTFYILPIVYLNKVSTEEYMNISILKSKKDFKDNIELQKILTEKIREVILNNEIYQFDVKKDILELTPIEINPYEKFQLKDPSYILSEFVQTIFY